MSTLRDILNRARWRDAGLHALEVHVLHRGAPGDRRVIAGSRITAVRSAGIELAPETEESDPIFVPYHRFLAVLDGEEREVWSKERGEASTAAAEKPSAPTLGGALASAKEMAWDIPVVLAEATATRPLVIDGSAGEGGGQILRSSLALAIATRTPFVLEKIRAGRKKPGLMRQHLTSVKAAAAVCAAEVEGAELGSARLVFRPGAIASGEHLFDIGSAGSVALVLQTIALPLALGTAASRVTVRGGTHALWAPIAPFLAEAWVPLMKRAGVDLTFELVSPGFHPAGGGQVVLTVKPSSALAPIHLGEASGALAPLALHAIVSAIGEGIARRELAGAAEHLKDVPLTLTSASVRSLGPGNAMWLVARDEGTGVVNVFSGVGEVGVRAEDIGRAVATEFLAWRSSGTSIEPHLADQVMLPIALAGAGSFTTNELTLHAKTNIEVIRAFTGHRLRAWDLDGSQSRVKVTLG